MSNRFSQSIYLNIKDEINFQTFILSFNQI